MVDEGSNTNRWKLLLSLKRAWHWPLLYTPECESLIKRDVADVNTDLLTIPTASIIEATATVILKTLGIRLITQHVASATRRLKVRVQEPQKEVNKLSKQRLPALTAKRLRETIHKRTNVLFSEDPSGLVKEYTLDGPVPSRADDKQYLKSGRKRNHNVQQIKKQLILQSQMSINQAWHNPCHPCSGSS